MVEIAKGVRRACEPVPEAQACDYTQPASILPF